MATDWAQFEPEAKQTDWSEFTPEEPTPKELGPGFPLQEGEPTPAPQQDTSAAQAMANWFQPAAPTGPLEIKPLGDVNAPIPETKSFMQEVSEPLVSYQLKHPADEGVLAAVGREAANLALGVAEFPTSELGVAAGISGALAPTATAGAFTLQMMKDLGNQVLSTYQNWGSMTPAQKAIALTDIAGTGVLGFLTGKATAKGLRRMAKTEPTIAAAEPILPQSAQAVKETKGAEEYASEIREAEKVYGDVQSQPVAGVREVPVEGSSPGVQPQAEGRVPEAQAVTPARPEAGQPRVLLKPQKREVGKAFESISRRDREDLLAEWESAELSADGERIIVRDKREGKGSYTLTRSQFFDWLFSDEAQKLSADADWQALVQRAREASGSKLAKATGLTPEEKFAEQRALDEALGQETEITPPPKETPTAPSAGEPSTLTPAQQGSISETTTPQQITQAPFLDIPPEKWTPEYWKRIGDEGRRTVRSNLQGALQKLGSKTKITERSTPQAVFNAIAEVNKTRTELPPTPEVGPGMVGMGGAAAGELSESAGADIYGIAQRVREQRSEAGQTPALPRGEGVSALETVQHGRRLIAADPLAAQKAVDAFNKTKAVSYDGIAAVRAKGEEAFMAARNIEQKFGTDSPEYRNAFEAASQWDKASKGMQTEWHKQGQAQQGQTDIDTGTFTGLQRAFRAATGKDFTPQQAKQAKEKVAVVQATSAEAEAATKKLFDAIDKVLPQGKAPVDASDARKQLSSFKPGAKPNLQQIRSIWSYVKSVYISRGEANLDAIAQKASDDLGIPKLDIIKAMASPKGARALTDDAFLKLQRQRQAINAAKNWLTTANMPGWERFVRKVPRFFFMTKVFGHGTVGMVTHAGSMAFDPAAMKSYWPVFLKQYGLVFSEKYHARLMQELMDDPYFATARRAGLANDPFRYQDDYQNPKLAGWFGRWGLAGNRGFDSLKLLRQARWNEIWDSFPDELKTKEMAKLLADQVNHATGIVRSDVLGRFAEPAGTILFAPKLEMSRWAFAVGDPAKATRIFLSWEKATPEERMFAISEVKQKARIFGVYMGLLALNESILQASGSDQRVNFNNPNRGDFLAFKVAGQNVSVISPMLHMGALLADMIKIGFLKRKGVEKITPRRSAAAAAIGRYAQGKLSPFAQPIADVWFQSTFENRPMPFSADRAAKWMRQRGMGRWTWPEYLSETFTPIPVSEAIREVWRSQGMNEDEMDKAGKALAVFTITGGTGVRLSQDIHRGGK